MPLRGILNVYINFFSRLILLLHLWGSNFSQIYMTLQLIVPLFLGTLLEALRLFCVINIITPLTPALLYSRFFYPNKGLFIIKLRLSTEELFFLSHSVDLKQNIKKKF